jgi:vacuolar-type H+-ATPase subunit E/Vma4
VQSEVEKLTGAIVGSAREEAKRIVEGVREEAQSALEAAGKEAENEHRATLERERAGLELERLRIISDATLRSQSLILSAKEKLIASVFEEALARIREFTSTPAYEDALLRLTSEALSMAGSGDVELLTNEVDANRLSRLVSGRTDRARLLAPARLSTAKINVIGGVVARSSTGKMEVDNTLDGRFSVARNTLRTEVSKMLFGGGSV